MHHTAYSITSMAKKIQTQNGKTNKQKVMN